MSEPEDRPPEVPRDPWARPTEPPAPSQAESTSLPGEGAPPAPGSQQYAPPRYAPPAGASASPGFVPPAYGPPPAYGSPPASAAPPAYGQPPAYGPPPYGFSGFTGGYPGVAAPQTSSRAITVLVLGIVGLLLLVAGGIGIVPAIIALAMSGGAKREIARSNGRLGGLGMITAARVLGWVTIAVFALLALGFIVAAAGHGGARYGGI